MVRVMGGSNAEADLLEEGQGLLKNDHLLNNGNGHDSTRSSDRAQ